MAKFASAFTMPEEDTAALSRASNGKVGRPGREEGEEYASFTGWFPKGDLKALKHLAVDRETDMILLLREALKRFLGAEERPSP